MVRLGRSFMIPAIRSFSPRAEQRCAQDGYSLVELLIALLVTSIIVGAAGFVLTEFLGSSRKIEVAQRVREAANRLNYLVQIEAGEASSINTAWTTPVYNGATLSACAFSAGVDTPLFSLVIPEKKGAYGVGALSSPVYYYLKAGNLRRCGPQVEPNGILKQSPDGGANPPQYVDGIVIRDASISVVNSANPACGNSITGAKTLVYTLAFPGVGWTPTCTVARAKTVYVCNNPSSQMISDAARSPSDPDYQPLPAGTCPQ